MTFLISTAPALCTSFASSHYWLEPTFENSTPKITILEAATAVEGAAAAAEEQLSKLHSVSQLSEKILENCGSSPLANVPNIRLTFSGDNDQDDFNLVRPCVKLSRQVEHFGKMIHERNSQFVSRFRTNPALITSQNSFYFVDDEVLALEKNTFQASDVDLPVVDQMHRNFRDGNLVTNPNVNVDSYCTATATVTEQKTITTRRKVSMEDHHKWNTFLKDISQLTIEIDDDNEEYL